MVAELEAETLCVTMGYVEPEALVATIGDICRGDGRDCSCDTEEVKARALVHRQADTIGQLKAKTSSDTLHDEKA